MHNIDFVTTWECEAKTVDGDSIAIPSMTRGIAIAFQDVCDFVEPVVFAKIPSIGDGIYCLPISRISYDLVQEKTV